MGRHCRFHDTLPHPPRLYACVTNAVMIRKAKAERIAALGVESVRNQRLRAQG
jgi:hypothetical protein